jgi:hypothetical protein
MDVEGVECHEARLEYMEVSRNISPALSRLKNKPSNERA